MSRREFKVRMVSYHSAQEKVLAESSRVNILQCGRRWGKTTLFVGMAIDALLQGKTVGYWVPVISDAKDVWAEAMARCGRTVVSANKIERRIKLMTGGTLDVWPLDKDGAGRGFFYSLALVDEGAKAKNLIQALDETIRPSLTDKRGNLWVASTPRGMNDFAKLGLRAKTEEGQKDGWRFWQMPTSSNPHMPKEELDMIKKELENRGKQWVWEQEYLGIPSDTGVNPFGLSTLRARAQKEPTHKPVIVWGLDLAKRVDFSVLTGIDADGHIAEFVRWSKMAYQEAVNKIIKHTQGRPIWVDATGVGDAVCDMLEAKGAQINRYVFTQSSRQSLLERLEEGLQDGWASALEGQMMSEMEMMEFAVRSGQVRYEVPGKGNGDTDDCIMSAALAYYGWRDMGYPRVHQRVVTPLAMGDQRSRKKL